MECGLKVISIVIPSPMRNIKEEFSLVVWTYKVLQVCSVGIVVV